jgi:hypothetical protein|tara:strand:- start:307 stop:561 length:255 start_codon:yes stop_codon:yes gene_type:complete
MCDGSRGRVKSLNDDSVKTYKLANSYGGTKVKDLPKGGAKATGKKKQEYDNAVSNIIVNRKIARSTLNIPTKNYNSGSGLKLPT